jgi:hypothetical protein
MVLFLPTLDVGSGIGMVFFSGKYGCIDSGEYKHDRQGSLPSFLPPTSLLGWIRIVGPNRC